MKKSAEVAIIGGGISGLSTAYNLANMGCKDVVLLEKESLYSGSTGRCAAGVRQQFGLEMNCRLAKGSCEILENLNELLDYERDIEFKQGGYLWLLPTTSPLRFKASTSSPLSGRGKNSKGSLIKASFSE